MEELGPDYPDRAKANHMASPQDILEAMKRPGAVVLDVRTEEEIKEAKLEDLPADVNWAKTGCTRTACPALETDPTQFVSDDLSQTIIIYCGSGARASQAKKTLEAKGYTNVLNGGGLKDMLTYPKLNLSNQL